MIVPPLFFTSLKDKFQWLAIISSEALPPVIVSVISVVVAKVTANSILGAECLRHTVIISRHKYQADHAVNICCYVSPFSSYARAVSLEFNVTV